tara:strand:- start:12415 stop:12933 length:519 start_codon:yes stop_codon:yes gene_type:complete
MGKEVKQISNLKAPFFLKVIGWLIIFSGIIYLFEGIVLFIRLNVLSINIFLLSMDFVKVLSFFSPYFFSPYSSLGDRIEFHPLVYVAYLFLGIFLPYVGLMFFKRNNLARKFVIFFWIVGIIFNLYLFLLPMGASRFLLLLNLYFSKQLFMGLPMFYYLLFNKRVKQFFSVE